MNKKLFEYKSQKYIGVSLFDNRLSVIELLDGKYIDEDLAEINSKRMRSKNKEDYNFSGISFWNNRKILKSLLSYCYKKTKKFKMRYKFFIVIPFGLDERENSLILDCCLLSGWRNVYMIDNYLCAAVGTGLLDKKFEKRIFVYSYQNITYIGIVFGGGSFNVKIIYKPLHDLNENDIIKKVQKVVSELPVEVPEDFTNGKLSHEDLRDFKKAWKSKLKNKILLCAPDKFRNRFGSNIGIYKLEYASSTNCILEGLIKIMERVKSNFN